MEKQVVSKQVASSEMNTLSVNDNVNWYIIHVYSGSEATVVNEIKQKLQDKDLGHLVEELVVPVKEVPQLKKGKKVLVKKNFLPGYVLLKAHLNEELLALIRSTPRVSGFLGTKRLEGVPKPVSTEEISNILHNIQESVNHGGSDSNRFEIGETVTIAEGPFATFSGSVEDISADKQKLKVSLSIFDRLVTVELNFDQVDKE